MAHRKSPHVLDDSQERLRRVVPPSADQQLGSGVVRGGPMSVQALGQLQRAVGNQAVSDLVAQRALVVQRDDYPYGSGNSVPHIHRYGSDCHLKIMDGSKIRRLNLVQGGKRYRDDVADAFSLARQSGNTTLVDAIKTCISGIGPFGNKEGDPT